MNAASMPAKLARNLVQSPTGTIVKVWRRLLDPVARKLAGPASRSGFGASLYYTFLSSRFYREHQAVLSGSLRYARGDLQSQSSFGGLRRNVHRIEKALIMRPRRASFAEGYIAETVAQFERVYTGIADPQEKKWAGDVLAEYFGVVKDTPVIAAARSRFEAIGYRRGEGDDRSFVPYAKHQVVPSGVTFEQLRALFVERRSVRWFDDRPVGQDLIEQAIEAAGWAPSACNRQPYRFHVALQPDAVERIAALAGGTVGFVHNIPAVIVIVGDLSNYPQEYDRHLIYIDGALAGMQLMLALQTLGLSTVPLNWPDIEKAEVAMQKELSLAIYERPIMLVGVGYGDQSGLIPFSQKKTLPIVMRLED